MLNVAIPLLPVIGAFVFYPALKKIMNKSRINLAIVGMSGAGKTTLFDAIRNEKRAALGETGREGDKLPEMEVKVGEKTITISETKDYDGNPSSTTHYKELFKKKDIIIFIFDAEEYEKNVVAEDGRSYQNRFIGQLNGAYLQSIKKERKVVFLLGSHKDKMQWKPNKLKKHIYTLMQKEDMEKAMGYFKIVFGNLTNKVWVNNFINENIFKYAK